MDILNDPKTFGLLVSLLFFLISFFVNLVQHRYSKARFNRMLSKDESVLKFLGDIHKSLGKLERNCTLELYGESSPQVVGKAVRMTRNEIQSTISDMEEHLRSFRAYRRKERAKEKHRKKLERLHQTAPEK
jgi:hypothetical protein